MRWILNCVVGIAPAIWTGRYRDKLTEKITEPPNASTEDATASP